MCLSNWFVYFLSNVPVPGTEENKSCRISGVRYDAVVYIGGRNFFKETHGLSNNKLI